MLNRQQCSTSNPCSKFGDDVSGCMSSLKSVGIGGHKLLPEAADEFVRMVNDMPTDIRRSIKLSDSYRPLEVQCKIFDFDHFEKTGKRRKKGTSGTPVARPGTSNHGWGRAIDISPKNVQDWIRSNGSKYGWCWGEVKSEPWHFTFCGAGPNRSKLCDNICGDVKGETPLATNKSGSKKIGPVGLSQNFYKGQAESNINLLIDKLKSKGITNPMVQAAFLGVVGKESGFIPQNETSYCNTPDSRIINIFGIRGRKCKKKKCNDEEFFECVYGKDSGVKLGNTQPGDGYKYRGRGFNGITGRAVYQKYGYESNPEDLNDIDGAADAAISFLASDGSSLNNRFKTPEEAVEYFVTKNAGGVRKPGEEEKAKKVMSRFNIGSEELGTGEYDTDLASTTDSGKTGEKKSLSSLLGLDDLNAIIALARGDESAFKQATSSLKEGVIIEEVDRIKDIMKKIL